MIAIALDNSSHEHTIRVDAIASELTDRIMRDVREPVRR
jgi:hypothetical protein